MAENTIPLTQAQTWRSNWKASGKAWVQANNLQGFTIPGDDLTQTMGEGAVDCRIYFGLTEEGTGGDAKVMMVGIDSEGNDMIDAANGQFIYDKTSSIPPGDPNSPLN